MQEFGKIERRRLSEVIANQIEDAIMSGTFSFGSQLPSEQQMAVQFGVSRNVVREAFKYLKERGLIQIRNGSGAYVSEPSTEPTSEALGRYIRLIGAQESIADLYEARRILEGSNVQLAAQRADSNDLAKLYHCLSLMETHRDSIELWSKADLDFHLAIAEAAHNAFLNMLLEPLVGQLQGVIAEGFMIPGAVERGLESHRKLYKLIEARDADGAYQAIIEHLRDSENRVQAIHSKK